MTTEGSLELVITPRSDRFDPCDDRWREQVGEFRAGLAREVGGVRRERIPVLGTKGGIERHAGHRRCQPPRHARTGRECRVIEPY